MSDLTVNEIGGIGATINQVSLSAGHTLNIKGTLDLSKNSGALQLPTGNTAQRPSSPNAGYIRWNTDNNAEGSEIGVEYFDGYQWYPYGEFTERAGQTSGEAVAYSALFDGNSDSLLIVGPTNGWLSSSNILWTIEFWMKDDSTTDNNASILRFTENSTNITKVDIKRENNDLVWSYNSGAGIHLRASGAWSTLGDGEWHHVAICAYNNNTGGSGSDWRMFIDGASVAYNAFGYSAQNDFGDRLRIGGAGNWYKGRVSNVRIVKGSLYPSTSLTVPIAALTTTSQGATPGTVELLMLGLNAVTPDVATKTPGSISIQGDVVSDPDNPFGVGAGGGIGPGEALFHATGPNSTASYAWEVPAGVEKIAVISVGGGGGGESNHDGAGGGGGSLSYSNNLTVAGGDTVSVFVGGGGMAQGWGNYGPDGRDSYVQIAGQTHAYAGGGTGGKGNYSSQCHNIPGGYNSNGDGGGNGGRSSHYSGCRQGGGGAGGYNGGGQTSSGRVSNPQYSGCSGQDGQAGGGGGGCSANGSSNYYCGGGGGVGIYGQGSNGQRANTSQNSYPNNETHFCGKGGSTAHNTGLRGYSNRSNNSTFAGSGSGYNRYHPSYNGNSSYTCADGGFPGGGGGGANSGDSQGMGGHGVVRIIWGQISGADRSFPSTNVNLTSEYDASYAENMTTQGQQMQY